jgi:hypothetical protein
MIFSRIFNEARNHHSSCYAYTLSTMGRVATTVRYVDIAQSPGIATAGEGAKEKKGTLRRVLDRVLGPLFGLSESQDVSRSA